VGDKGARDAKALSVLVLVIVRRLGKRISVPVEGLTVTNSRPKVKIRSAALLDVIMLGPRYGKVK